MTVRVVTDSASDLPAELAEELDIEIMPLKVRFGDEEFVDRHQLTTDEFWRRCNASAELPSTAAPSPGEFEEAFRRAAASGAEGVVCICLSGALSATYEAAQQAARTLEGQVDVRVIDSRALTLAEGVIAVQAARAAQDGKSIDDIVGLVEDLIPRTRIYAALDTLENLKKGGRIGGAQAMIGSMLSIKPVIELNSGKVEQESKQRTRGKALRYLVDKVAEHAPVENLAVMHGDAPDVEEFLEMLSAVHPREGITVARLGPVIGAHGGPRLMGVTFQSGS